MDKSDIIEDEENNHGIPSLPEGYTVLQVVKLIRGGYSMEKAAERLDVEEDSIQAALEYYHDNEDKIEALLEEEIRVVERGSLENND